MKDKLIDKAAAYLLRKHRRQRWRQIVSVFAAIVVFVTTYALILPAITLESNSDITGDDYMYPVPDEEGEEYDIPDSGGEPDGEETIEPAGDALEEAEPETEIPTEPEEIETPSFGEAETAADAEPETEAPGELTEPETEATEELTEPETEATGELTEPETEAPEELTEPETEATGELTEPETEATGELKEPETEAAGPMEIVAVANGMLFSARLSGACDGINWLLTPAAGGGYRLVLSADTSTVIPSGLLSDSVLSTYINEISAVEIGADITEIGANAFYDAAALRSVAFDDGSALMTIGSGAFAGCGNLASVNLESCANLTTIAGGDTPETGAFSGTGLTEVIIPAGVTTMGDFAFFGCQNLSAVNFEENYSLTDMGAYVFARCTALQSINLENLKGENLTFGTKDSVTFGETTITNGNGLCYGCTSLQSLILPDMSGSVAYLCKECSSLTALSLDNCAKLVCDDTSGNSAFLNFVDGCGQLEILDLSGVTGMTTLYNGIVSGGVKTLILPSTLTRVAQTALGWTNVEEVVFTKDSDGKSNLKQIGGTNRNIPSHTQAFASADKLRELYLEFDPDASYSDLFLMTSAFLNCYNLETLSISSPAGLQELGEGCFADCRSLQNLIWDVKSVNTVINWGWPVGTLSENISFTVGPNVEVLPGYLLSSMKDNILKYIFTPGCSFYVTGIAGGPFTEAGCYYADENGNLYRLNSDFTAELVYANRSGSGAFAVPRELSAKLCTGSGRSDTETSFTVTGVCKDAFADTGYSTVTFAAPENITVIEDSAFAGAYNLEKINEMTTEQEIKALFTNSNVTFGSDLFVGTKITGSTFENADAVAVYPGGDAFGIADNLVQIGAASDSKLTAIQNKNHLATGETANITVGVSSNSSEKRVRLYLKVSDPESFTLQNSIGSAPVSPTSVNGIYYCDIPIPEGSEPITYSLGITCNSLTAPGKKAYVWLLEADSADVLASLGNAVVDPGGTYPSDGVATAAASGKYIEITYDVLPKEYSVTKTVNEAITPTLKKTAGADSASTVVGLSFIVRNSTANRDTTDGKSYDSYGADFVDSVSFTDVLELPKGLKWTDGLLGATFTSSISGDKTGGSITATINGKAYTLCTLNLASDFLTDLTCIAKGENLEIAWTTANRDVTNEITAAATTLTYGPEVITVDGAVTEATELSVTNTITAVPIYTYSGAGEPITDRAIRSLTADPSPLAASKVWVKMPTHMGEEAVYQITLDHVADANAASEVDIYDDLGTHQYLASETIEEMLLGDGHDGDYLTITINNAVILPVPDTQTVTAVDGVTQAQTSVKNTGKTTVYNDLATEYDYGDAEITIKKADNEKAIIVTVAKANGEITVYSVGTGKDYASLQSALDAIGYVRSILGSCLLHWHFPQNAVSAEETHKEYYLHTFVKNSFQMMTVDHNASIVSDVAGGGHTYPVSNKLYTSTADYTGGNNAIQTDAAETYYDLSIDKLTKVDGQDCDTSALAAIMEERLKDGGSFVIDYSLDIRHYGTGSYGLLPVVDHMTGIQALLAEVDDNTNADGTPPVWAADTQIYSDGEKSYYILNANGTEDGNAVVYKGVWLENGYADSVTVTKNAGGLDTLIKWYYIDNTKSSYTLAPAYRAICSTTYTGGTDTEMYHAVYNEAWVNDVPTRRLHDIIGAEGASIAFEKHIVTEKGASPADDTLWSDDSKPYPIAGAGEKVTYRLDFKRTGVLAISLAGQDFYDTLPAVALNSDGTPVFAWTDENVKVSYAIVGEGVTVSDASVSGYDIVRDEKEPEKYRIRWNDDFSINFPAGAGGEVYIYVELTFPEGDEWAQYVAAYGSTILYNTLSVRDVDSFVSHMLPVPGEAMLRKGVYETGYYVLDSNQNTVQYFRGADRSHYVKTAENDAVKNTVTYFVTLYNSSDNTNLYLSPIYDKLPEGFKFYSLVSTPISSDNSMAYSGSVYLKDRGGWAGVIGSADVVELTAYGYAPLAQPAGASTILPWDSHYGENRTVRVRSPYDTRMLIFDVVLDSDHQDELGYYLKPGEAIQFGYMCFTGDADVASADNRCAMEYMDYSNSGVSLTEESAQTVTVNNDVFSAAANTGAARLINNERAAELGFTETNPDNPAVNRRWLISRVSLTEGDIIPGITLKVDNYNVQQGDPVGWTVTSTNNGTVAMRDYTIADTMQSPFGFTGRVSYSILSGNASTYSKISTDNRNVVTEGNLFEITSSGDSGVTLKDCTGTEYTVSYGQIRELTAAVKSAGGATCYAPIAVLFTREENGDMTMSIRFSDPTWSIPADGESILTVSTGVPEGTASAPNGLYVNNAVITPTQYFDPNSVTQGTVSTDGKSDSSAASVNIYTGILTTAYKEVGSGEKYGVSPNYAGKGESPDRIVLGSRSDPITYTLNVNGAADNNMRKLVLIDSLPEFDDTNPINPKLKRGSQFKVNFAEDPNVTVEVVTKDVDGTITNTEYLTNDSYSVKYSVKASNFGTDADYVAGGESADEWHAWNDSSAAADRSIRVVIDRALTENETVRVSFRAKIDVNAAGENAAQPGEIAWNNFGYSFLTNAGMWLYAAPQKVGVTVHSAPTVAKEIVNSTKEKVSAAEDTEFSFVIYKGSDVAFNKYDAASVGEALSNAGKEFTYATVTVNKGKSSGELELDPLTTYRYTYENSAFTKGTDSWIWVDGERYTVVEIDENKEYSYGYTDKPENTARPYTFTYDETKNRTVTVYNIRHDWSITVTKTNESNMKLSGAVFGLYSMNENPDIKEQFDAAGLPENMSTTYTASDGKLWYLSSVAVTGADGTLTWTGLCEDSYLVLELKPPDGYIPSVEALTLTYDEARDGSYTAGRTVVNTAGRVIPDTGGCGTVFVYIMGSLLIAAALWEFLRKRRRE